MMLVELSDIKIGNRFRKDLGDINSLAKSIKELGLIQSIVITGNNELICGRRRIAAFEKLGISEISALIADSSKECFESEAAENIIRKNFTIGEIAEIDQFYRDKEEAAAKERQKIGKANAEPSGNFPTGRSREKIAARVGVSDRTLEKIRSLKDAATRDPITYGPYWEKANSERISIDKAYRKVKQRLRTEEAREAALNCSGCTEESSLKLVLKLGDMRELGQEIVDNSIDMIFTDPPYSEASLFLYGELAKLSNRVLKPGGSLITFIGHYALFKIGKLIEDNSDLEFHWIQAVKHNGHTTKMWKQRIWPRWKPLLWYYKPKPWSGNGNGKDNNGPTMFSDIADLIESQPVEKNNHKWEQSTIEAEHMIKPLTVEGMTVLDPFMGSGTTGMAALDLKRRFIGIEIDKDHFQIAKAQLTNKQTE